MTRTIPLSFGLLSLPRDVGGYPTGDGRQVAWGKLLLRTGEAGLTRAEARQLDQHGITTHIALCFSDDGVPFPPVDFHLSHARSVAVFSAYPDLDSEGLRPISLIETEKTVIKHLIMAITDAPEGTILISGHHGEYLEWLSVMVLGLLGVVDHALIEHTALNEVALVRIQSGHDEHRMINHVWDHAASALRSLRHEYHSFEAYAKVVGLSHLDLVRLKNRLLED